MNIHLTDFQRTNTNTNTYINDEDILPLYVKQNGINITSNKKIIFSVVGIVCFFISYIGLYNLRNINPLFIDDDNRFHFLQIYE
jgi:hypothetical protein